MSDKEYIERGALERFIENGLNEKDPQKHFGYDGVRILAEVHHMPAADVEPVIRDLTGEKVMEKAAVVGHARWKNDNDGCPHCTHCDYIPMFDRAIDDIYYSPYCPNCGYKMDEHDAE